MVNCPKCNAPTDSDAEECPQCGIFFSKWQERETNVAAGNMERYVTIANATSSEFNWTMLIVICMVVASVFFFLEGNQ